MLLPADYMAQTIERSDARTSAEFLHFPIWRASSERNNLLQKMRTVAARPRGSPGTDS
jgi:hypothetical protein